MLLDNQHRGERRTGALEAEFGHGRGSSRSCASQRELVIMQEYVKALGLKVVVVFEVRDAAGKGGLINRISERTNPGVCPSLPYLPRRSGRRRSGIPAVRAALACRRRDSPVRSIRGATTPASSG